MSHLLGPTPNHKREASDPQPSTLRSPHLSAANSLPRSIQTIPSLNTSDTSEGAPFHANST
eukprot:3488065-Amphidinium_carterae.1